MRKEVFSLEFIGITPDKKRMVVRSSKAGRSAVKPGSRRRCSNKLYILNKSKKKGLLAGICPRTKYGGQSNTQIMIIMDLEWHPGIGAGELLRSDLAWCRDITDRSVIILCNIYYFRQNLLFEETSLITIS